MAQKFNLKPLNEQVMVITGASSGIGLSTAHAAAQKGVKLVLAARSQEALDAVAQQINNNGGQAIAVTADVGSYDDLERIGDAAIVKFGRIDTWVNDAGIAIYGKLEEVAEEDSRKLFDTNFWGVVNGSLIAVRYLKQNGGALINLGSEVSDAVYPLLGMYCASKHAVKGFTDCLRIELEIEEAPVSVTLIQPTAVDTPFPNHAKNYMQQEPDVPQPRLDPSKVAEAILDAAVNPARDVRVGFMAKVNVAMAKFAPRIAGKVAAGMREKMHQDRPPRNPEGALHKPSDDPSTHAHGHKEQQKTEQKK